MRKIIVIGAGASGLAAAITAARNGAAVTVLEANSRPGKKLLVTGNGRCNIAHSSVNLEDYNYKSNDIAKNLFKVVSLDEVFAFFRSVGVFTTDLDGYVYPNSEEASAVVRALVSSCEKLGVKIKNNNKVVGICKNADSRFIVKTDSWEYDADKVIVACGSNASSVEGSDGSGYEILKNLGIDIVSPLPALVPIKCVGEYFAKWKGIRVRGKVSVIVGNETECCETGQIQLTDYGVSGIPVFNISGTVSRLINAGKKVFLQIDFVPEIEKEEIVEFMNENGLEEGMRGMLPLKLANLLISFLKDNTSNDEALELMKNFTVAIKDTLGFENAQTVTGGVEADEFNCENMESKKNPGLYFSGEIIDCDGKCGGFNLLTAWITGIIAGGSASK